ncbi:hypothetical protein GC088_13940 [Arthrobacter sp. JZ12]|uniref:hypothetical protein n=1 Tax=Arthrobacter sp. JZ12 TaxID=2654190 RepID=UPI002B46188B|nr:hypothetical protein [Arthrobacter sp. JZ12]WRH26059.1 hypothetical protein GC088_13940 [Arthrobacter sp. JZ12]
MAERGNTTHGPHVDDQMKHETQGLVQGGHHTRAEDWRETETIDDDVDVPLEEAPVYERQPNQGNTGDDTDTDDATTDEEAQ